MHISMKKFFFVLCSIVIVAGVLLFYQIQRARQITTRSSNASLVAASATDIPLSPLDPILGNPGADLTIVEFVDLNNITSKQTHKTLENFVLENPTKVRLIWKDYPQDHLFAGNATQAHEAALCAHVQHKFWPYLDTVLSQGKSLNDKNLTDAATSVGLNIKAWSDCVHSTAPGLHVAESVSFARTQNYTVYPIVFLNNKMVNPEQSIDWDQLLTQLIK